MTKIAIIGAGLSGLSAAHLLNDDAEITLFEKARGVGGRMSTRRTNSCLFDHGAQYFTARTQAFQDFIQPLIDEGIIEQWSPRYAKFDGHQIIEQKNWIDEEPRYVGVPNMNNVAKYLAENFDININTHIKAIEHKEKWQMINNEGAEFGDFDWVISTAPSPQTIELLPKSFKYYSDIQTIKMKACFSLMLGFEQSLPLKFDAAHISNSTVSWLAVNSNKPRRTECFTLIVHSSEEYAEAHINDDSEKVMKHLIAETSKIIEHDVSNANYKTIHKWRYAQNAKRKGNSPIFLDKVNQLAVCGDWCLGGRVEGAFTSAYNLVNAMKVSVL